MSAHSGIPITLRLLLGIAVSGLVAGCASVHFTPTGPPRPPQPPGSEVKIFLTGVPTADFDEIGLLEVSGNLRMNMEDVADETRLRGGNAVALLSSEVHVTTSHGVKKAVMKDADGKVVATHEVPYSSIDTHELHRFVALWLYSHGRTGEIPMRTQ